MARRTTAYIDPFPSGGIMLALAVMIIFFFAVILMSVAFISNSEVKDTAMKQPVSRRCGEL